MLHTAIFGSRSTFIDGMYVRCRNPSFGDGPCGEPGGPANYHFENGNSMAFVRLNFMPKLKPVNANATRSARVVVDSLGCNSSIR